MTSTGTPQKHIRYHMACKDGGLSNQGLSNWHTGILGRPCPKYWPKDADHKNAGKGVIARINIQQSKGMTVATSINIKDQY